MDVLKAGFWLASSFCLGMKSGSGIKVTLDQSLGCSTLQEKAQSSKCVLAEASAVRKTTLKGHVKPHFSSKTEIADIFLGSS